jgi:vitamin B12 transporter
MVLSRRVLRGSAFMLSVLVASTAAWGDPLRVVVTAFRYETPIARSGSSITVVGADALENASPGTLTNIMRAVPGANVVESGGTGATAEVRLRGAETGHTLVLIDGVRVNDSATVRDEFDFSLVNPDQIERIEILRGPQTALYGSDAMGGVVNIITKKPVEGSRLAASVEGGSYGTFAQALSGSLRSDDTSVLLSASHFRTEGFSRVGDREHDELDGSEKWNGTLRASYRPAGQPHVDLELTASDQRSDYDGTPPNPPPPSCTPGMACYTTYLTRLATAANALNTVHKQLLTGYARLSDSAFDGAYDHSLTAFTTLASRHNKQPPTSTFDFRSAVTGAEYQGVGDLNDIGTLLLGSRIEHEVASYEATGFGFTSFNSTRTFYALFAQHEASFGERLHVSFGGRYDGEVGGEEGFLTGRATAAYEMPETGSRLRASVGTGAKRPTAYQVANNLYAAVTYPLLPVPLDLAAENNIGVDAGIDQTLLDGRVTLSATAFWTRFRDMLDFVTVSTPPALPGVFDVYYENIKNAQMAGVELSGGVVIVPGVLEASGGYTWLDARNLDTGKLLERRPIHSATAALTYTGIEGLEATLSATYVGLRYNRAGEVQALAPYTRLDLAAAYELTPNLRLFGRIENLTNATYQDPGGYNTAGFSVYAGLKWTDNR